MSSALAEIQEAETPSKQQQQLMAVARSGLKVLVKVVPSLVGAGLWGAIKGAVIFGTTGLAVGVGYLLLPQYLGTPATPIWLKILSGVLPPVALSVAGGYILMLQGVTARLAREVQERGLVGYLYAIIKPTVVQVAHRLRGSSTLSRTELTHAIERSLNERVSEAALASDREPASRTERLERFLMMQSRRVLCLVAVRTALSAPDAPTAVKELETLGIDRLENALAETLEDLFNFHMLIGLVVGLLVAALPPLLMVLLR